jgi:hypothetical protein
MKLSLRKFSPYVIRYYTGNSYGITFIKYDDDVYAIFQHHGTKLKPRMVARCVAISVDDARKEFRRRARADHEEYIK